MNREVRDRYARYFRELVNPVNAVRHLTYYTGTESRMAARDADRDLARSGYYPLHASPRVRQVLWELGIPDTLSLMIRLYKGLASQVEQDSAEAAATYRSIAEDVKAVLSDIKE